ncbi:hypothetical protein BW687_003840 [Pseudomonas graminis]|jgi:hypothetical protein|uniref:hypothetical protein n=1 Tax=Pseudomonas graminis TaxID=158627 RepID=UPI0013CEB1F2|nr:hypothetical protein [Pseudomonas graminis]MDC6379308.1 hypothetical protein [Pseudomonas graminis]
MKRVGFQGGSSIFELGIASDMACFFSVIRGKIELSRSELLILDRLYRRYLRLEELEGATVLMLRSRQCLAGISTCMVELEGLGWRSNNSCLDSTCLNYAEIFVKYFDGFEYCVESAKGFYEDWGVYKPVRTVVCDMPDYMVEKLRPLDEYDSLGANDPPFWLR